MVILLQTIVSVKSESNKITAEARRAAGLAQLW